MNATKASEETLFETVSQLPPDQWAAFLEQACGRDTVLRERLEVLLSAHQRAGSFMTQPAGPDRSRTEILPIPLNERLGDHIGAYKLLQQIGEGGCGVVYMAEQEEPVRRRVALKIIKLGMDTKQVVARFEAERQALALMDHPNIAKVLDAGATNTGRPYFVMELVRGIKITDYCDQNKLGTRQRLDLFVQICRAVQHAHQKGIIHRDLKPSNILVTLHDGVPVPKVIDFGIAKATTDQRLTNKTLFTALEQFIGTPAYMSPEQIELSGLDIDTRSDIYSLGVLLYELLTGKTPFDARELLAAGLEQMRRTIREEEPVRPSTRLSTMLGGELVATANMRQAEAPKLVHLVRGDLDWIVMKCLEKDRTRRYETANGLAMDIQRHLENQPVLARPPSRLYEFQKRVRRHKVEFAASAAVLVALIFGVMASTSQAIRATRAERTQVRLRLSAQANEQQAQRAQALAVQERQLAVEARAQAEAQELAARQRAYSSEMSLAQQRLAAGNLGQARELLNRQKPGPGQTDLRGWEWRFLWERARGDELFTLRGHSDEVPVALFLGDNQTAFSAGSDHTLKFWDLQKRSVIQTLPYPDLPRRAAVSPDGRLLAVGGWFGYWSLWDAVSRQLLLARTNATGVTGLAFSPDGHRLAIADDDYLEIWEPTELRLLKRFNRNPERFEDRFVIGLAFSPDGRKLAYAHGSFAVVVHDLESDEELTLGQSGHGLALSLAFSPDGRVLLSSDRLGITVWDPIGRNPPHYLTNHNEQVVCIAFSPDGKLLASASGDQTIKLWDTQSWEEVATLKGHEHEVHSVAFSSDGKLLISSGKDQTVRLWNAQRPMNTRESLVVPSNWDYRFGSPNWDRTAFISGNHTVTLVELATLAQNQPQPLPTEFQSQAVFTCDRHVRLAAAALKEGPIELWRTEPFSKLTVIGPGGAPAVTLALGEEGRWLAVQRTNETTELWDIEKNRLIETFAPLPVPVCDERSYKGLSFWAADRCLLRATSSRQTDPLIEIIRVPNGARCLVRPKHLAATSGMESFALSQDGELLATGGWDARVKLYDAHSGRELAVFSGQLIGFVCVAFSPDSSRLAAGGWDGTVTLWDVRSRQQVCNWKAHERNCALVSFQQGGESLASAGDAPGAQFQREIRLWRAPALAQIVANEQAGQLSH